MNTNDKGGADERRRRLAPGFCILPNGDICHISEFIQRLDEWKRRGREEEPNK